MVREQELQEPEHCRLVLRELLRSTIAKSTTFSWLKGVRITSCRKSESTSFRHESLYNENTPNGT